MYMGREHGRFRKTKDRVRARREMPGLIIVVFGIVPIRGHGVEQVHDVWDLVQGGGVAMGKIDGCRSPSKATADGELNYKALQVLGQG
jgi:hypothetical protein